VYFFYPCMVQYSTKIHNSSINNTGTDQMSEYNCENVRILILSSESLNEIVCACCLKLVLHAVYFSW